MITHITLTLITICILFFLGLFYLYYKNRKNVNFFYASVPFLFTIIALLGQFQLSLGFASDEAIFWTKFKYVGIFGYIFAFPVFAAAITEKHLRTKTRLMLSFITVICFGLILFTNLIISNSTHYYSDILIAKKNFLYPFLMVIFFIITIYYYFQIIIASKGPMKHQTNYWPIIIGIGLGIGTGIADVIGLISGKPFIARAPNLYIFGTFIVSLTFAWTFLSRYSWVFDALTRSEEQVARLIAKSNQNFMEFVQLVAKTLEAKDYYTAGHSLRVMDYAVKIAQALNLPEKEIELLKHACLLHDIGKIGIPDGILNKKSPLTEKDRKHIINHPILGRQILSTATEFQEILDIIYSHHERIDGKGYPAGLSSDEIPLLARIIAVADAYDAMLSERPYRKAKTQEEAVIELNNVKGSQLDELLVEKFVQLIEV